MKLLHVTACAGDGGQWDGVRAAGAIKQVHWRNKENVPPKGGWGY